jgi:hypothetical protein
MVIVPLRAAAAVVAATLKVTVPVPLPLAPVVIVIHEALLCAVQPQPAVVCTVVDPVPPALPAAMVVGAIVNEHAAAACETVKVCPPRVMTPCRVCVCALAAAEKNTVPFPLPLAPAVIVNHDAPLDADHAQPAGAVTAVDPVPPPVGIDAPVGASENVQPAAP